MTLLNARQASALTKNQRVEIDRVEQADIQEKKREAIEIRKNENQHKKILTAVLKKSVDGLSSLKVETRLPNPFNLLDSGFEIFINDICEKRYDEQCEVRFEKEFELLLGSFEAKLKAISKSKLNKEAVTRISERLCDVLLEIKHCESEVSPGELVEFVRAELRNEGKEINSDVNFEDLLNQIYDFASRWGEFWLETADKSYERPCTREDFNVDEGQTLAPGNFYTIVWGGVQAYSLWDIEDVWSAQSMAWLRSAMGQEYMRSINACIKFSIDRGSSTALIEYSEYEGWWDATINSECFKRIPSPKQMDEILKSLGYQIQQEGTGKRIHQKIQWSA